MTGLPSGTTIYFRARATNSGGIGYSGESFFDTDPGLPTVTTLSPLDVTDTTATLRGDVTADGGRHNREDQRLRIRVSLRKKIGKNKVLSFTSEWLDSDSDREDPTVETDEVGYQEFIIGARFTYRF